MELSLCMKLSYVGLYSLGLMVYLTRWITSYDNFLCSLCTQILNETFATFRSSTFYWFSQIHSNLRFFSLWLLETLFLLFKKSFDRRDLGEIHLNCDVIVNFRETFRAPLGTLDPIACGEFITNTRFTWITLFCRVKNLLTSLTINDFKLKDDIFHFWCRVYDFLAREVQITCCWCLFWTLSDEFFLCLMRLIELSIKSKLNCIIWSLQTLIKWINSIKCRNLISAKVCNFNDFLKIKILNFS